MNEELQKVYSELEKQMKLRRQRAEGTIVDVQVGRLCDFIPKARLRNPDRGDLKAIQLIVQTPDQLRVKKAMVLSCHPNSALMKYRQKFGKFPEIGDKIELTYDESTGFWRIIL